MSYDAGANSISLVDECDHFMYGDPNGFKEFIQDKRVIGYTATPTDEELESLESKVQCNLGLHIIKYWPPSIPKPKTPTFDVVVDFPEEHELATYVKKCLMKSSVLLYCK